MFKRKKRKGKKTYGRKRKRKTKILRSYGASRGGIRL
ncbi:MAG: hypothetical protein [Arizlama microvirus]|nr:MAG: hypothetical protein [Arizlama microvirus]